MTLDCWIIINVDSWNPLFWNAIVSGDKIQSSEIVSISLDIPASKNWSYNFSRFRIGSDKFSPFGLINDEGFIAASLNSVVDLNIPISERCSDGLDFALDGLLDGVEDDPALVGGEGAVCGVVSNKTAGKRCHLIE